MIRNMYGTIMTVTVGGDSMLRGQRHNFLNSRWRPPEPCAQVRILLGAPANEQPKAALTWP
jgi:hypothetical protein